MKKYNRLCRDFVIFFSLSHVINALKTGFIIAQQEKDVI